MIERNSSRSPSGPASTPEPAEQNPESGGRRGDAEQSGGRDGVGTYLEDFEIDTRPVGFVAVAFHDDPRSAEIDMIAVDPDQQCRGVGSALLAFALDRISAAGIHLAHIATGGDPGHAAARHTYEKAGFTALPLVRCYKELPAAYAD
ncbi:GNAT family N-acetyltransferase [Streptomyces sp. NPDC056190]|uniref:GNAT family N-acetyltransferase n=1 Tax=unclassified Streptomyces TaxID=2593676 RepID=UPI0035E27F61